MTFYNDFRYLRAKGARRTLERAPTVAPPDRESQRKHLTIKEWRVLLAQARLAGVFEEALVLVTYEAGLRREELGKLRLSYVAELHKTGRLYVHRGKGSAAGYCDLSKAAQGAVHAWVKEAYPERRLRRSEAFLFPGKPRGRAGALRGVTGRTVYNVVHRLAEEAGIPADLCHPHVLKHSRVQHLMELMHERGKSPWEALQAIAQIVGHRSAQTTIQHYLARTAPEKALARDVTEELSR